jgi:transposase
LTIKIYSSDDKIKEVQMSIDLNVKPYSNKQLLLFPASIGDYLREDDLAHVVDEAVDEIDLLPYYLKIPPIGNPSYHPALMVKIWFYGYATKTYSSRKIEEKLHKDVAFIYLAGMQKPDFKAISEFRRKNLSELKNSFMDILQICHCLGLTGLGEICIDSKIIKANASLSRTYGRKNSQGKRRKSRTLFKNT